MKKRWISALFPLLLLFLVAALVMEILPYGAVLNFRDEEGSVRKTYSYFSLTPVGYANFAPFLTALFTCLLLLLTIVEGIRPSVGLCKVICAFTLAAFLLSLAPLCYGFRYMSALGAAISACLACALLSAALLLRSKQNA